MLVVDTKLIILAFEPFAVNYTAVPFTALKPLVGKLTQIFLRVHTVGRIKARKKRLSENEIVVTHLCDLSGVFDSTVVSAEKLRHFVSAFHIKLISLKADGSAV